jgi:hypothetical protein
MKGLDGKQFTADADTNPSFTTWLQTIGSDFLYVGLQAYVP